ncbi:hypothetical protein ACFY8O_01435 [Streptomyces argenteolus]|uniref:Uncharacterized protein n=1 Tax=Streptomyces argenteolus TaxID=67274 RepID=A0ABW6WYE3_9ACTN
MSEAGEGPRPHTEGAAGPPVPVGRGGPTARGYAVLVPAAALGGGFRSRSLRGGLTQVVGLSPWSGNAPDRGSLSFGGGVVQPLVVLRTGGTTGAAPITALPFGRPLGWRRAVRRPTPIGPEGEGGTAAVPPA